MQRKIRLGMMNYIVENIVINNPEMYCVASQKYNGKIAK